MSTIVNNNFSVSRRETRQLLKYIYKKEKPAFNTGTGTPALLTKRAALNLILTSPLIPPMKGVETIN